MEMDEELDEEKLKQQHRSEILKALKEILFKFENNEPLTIILAVNFDDDSAQIMTSGDSEIIAHLLLNMEDKLGELFLSDDEEEFEDASEGDMTESFFKGTKH